MKSVNKAMKFVRLDSVADEFRVSREVLLAEFRTMTDREKAGLAEEVYQSQQG